MMVNEENPVFVTKCDLCQGKIRLLKDPEDKVYHGDCWSALNRMRGSVKSEKQKK